MECSPAILFPVLSSCVQGCHYLDDCQQHPTNLVCVENVVIASVMDGPLLYLFDASSTNLIRTIDMNSICLLVGQLASAHM